MIRYSLVCDRGHDFDSWFDSAAAYDRLNTQGLVECPHCGSRLIRKAPMAPNISPTTRRRGGPTPAALAAQTAAADTGVQMGPPDERLIELRDEARRIARAIREHVTNTADYVGPRFAEEARRMHFGEVEPHGIYGEATAEEVGELAEDGIEVHPLPQLPEDGN